MKAINSHSVSTRFFLSLCLFLFIYSASEAQTTTSQEQRPYVIDKLKTSAPRSGYLGIVKFDSLYSELIRLPDKQRIDLTRQVILYIDSANADAGPVSRIVAGYGSGGLKAALLNTRQDALMTTLDAADLAEATDQDFLLYLCMMQAAQINFRIGNDTEAVRLGSQAIAMQKKVSPEPFNYLIRHASIHFMNLCNSIGMAHTNLQHYDSALKYFHIGQDFARTIDTVAIHNSRAQFWDKIMEGNIGLIYKSQGKLDLASRAIYENYLNALQHKDWRLACEQASILTEIYITQKNFAQATRYMDSIQVFLTRNPERPDYIKADLKKLKALLESAKGNYKQAFELQSQYTDERLLLVKRQRAEIIANVQGAYDFARNQRKIDTLQLDNDAKQSRIRTQWIWVGVAVVGLILASLLAITYIQGFRRQRQVNKIMAEQQDEIKQKNILLNEQKDEIEKQNTDLSIALEKLKVTQTLMVQSEKMASLGQLTAGLAHEINNPINFVQSGTESLENNMHDLFKITGEFDKMDETNFQNQLETVRTLKKKLHYEELRTEIQTLLATIRKGALRTSSVVSRLQIFSRNGQEDLSDILVSRPIEETLLLIASELKGRIEIETHFGEELIISGKMSELEQAFMNIFMNAVQAIQGPGKITVSASKEENYAKVVIADTGPGIPEDILTKVFDPFFTTKNVGKGTGLGLSITHGIITSHGGSISILSQPGKGTEVVVLLPLAQA